VLHVFMLNVILLITIQTQQVINIEERVINIKKISSKSTSSTETTETLIIMIKDSSVVLAMIHLNTYVSLRQIERKLGVLRLIAHRILQSVV